MDLTRWYQDLCDSSKTVIMAGTGGTDMQESAILHTISFQARMLLEPKTSDVYFSACCLLLCAIRELSVCLSCVRELDWDVLYNRAQEYFEASKSLQKNFNIDGQKELLRVAGMLAFKSLESANLLPWSVPADTKSTTDPRELWPERLPECQEYLAICMLLLALTSKGVKGVCASLRKMLVKR